MKIDRRSFLALTIGGAAGTALTPLPWKLTDDSSIWSQNWPWTPVPAKGENSYAYTSCTLCPGGCGLMVRMVGDRAVKIEGLEGHPINDGGICILGLSGLQLLYGATRVKTPLKRIGKRGEGRWEKISWDEALANVTAKLGQLRDANQSHTVACILGSKHGTTSTLFKRFMTAYGSPNVMTTPSVQDTLEMTLQVMHGVEAEAGFDIENSDYILSFGSGLIEGWGSPVRMFRANSAWRENGVKVVQVEPRLSSTAAKSDQWIPINPGTEAALAMGIAHILIKESLFDNDFIENHTEGFAGWKKMVLDEYTPEKVAAITGVGKTAIVRVAREFAGADKPLALCGRGCGDTPGSLAEAMAVHTVNALVGSINREGGVIAVPMTAYVAWPDMTMDSMAQSGMVKSRVDGAGSDKFPMAASLLNRFAGGVIAADAYPVNALLISGANPVYATPDAQAFKKAVEKIPFVVSFSSYMDETSMNADLILPNHVYLERLEDVPVTAGLQKPMVGMVQPVVYPLHDTRHAGDVVIELARSMGGSVGDAFPWDNYEACLEAVLGEKWDALSEEGLWQDENFQPAEWGEAFETASGKFEFMNLAMGLMPSYVPLSLEGNASTFPLLLIPFDSMRLASRFISDPPFVIKAVEDTVLKGKEMCVEINPATAKSLGLANGKSAILSTPKGGARVKIYHYDGIMPGVVAVPRGLGHTADDKYMAGKGANFNALIGPVEDRASGLDTAWGIRAKLAKA
ncbi:MAG: molybdopterin-dependent oxidoreductase [Deltaproteobacteria bacterium]|nr:molybdopterin-dependent oxidoreductase [Deltaproteobacteria bacterium]